MKPAQVTSHEDAQPLALVRLADPPEETADLTECWALTDRHGQATFQGLRSAMALAGSADAYVEPDELEYAETGGAAEVAPEVKDTDRYEAAAEAAFAEIFERTTACGPEGYPFCTTPGRIAARKLAIDSAYAFMLLLSRFGPNAGPEPNQGAKLFEELCASALRTFLGGPGGLAAAHVFGFPRRVDHTGFASALDELCARMDEGDGHRTRPKTSSQKDAKLDVVAWKAFPDGKKGKLIIFGQCATGQDWKDKRGELSATENWCSSWMKDRPYVWPVRAFFAPHRVPRDEWFHTCANGGLLFDRCRIACHCCRLPDALGQSLAQWSSHVCQDQRAH